VVNDLDKLHHHNHPGEEAGEIDDVRSILLRDHRRCRNHHVRRDCENVRENAWAEVEG